MSEISKQIVDQIESGKLNDAKDSIFQGIKQKAADAVDMKRVEMSVDWANGENLETDISDTE
ncbi:MAG: hypothetical protein CMD25_00300 [Flavobacteriales bacterium]|nr:hypothetical protein [Flavobacteriales bacterium]|tara:strand:- start:2588 stop:2773 length:186 start_codon:yes stop_codon:yes gene_type:complete